MAKLSGFLKVAFLPYLLVIPILLFQALSISGCISTSPSLPDLYIVSFSRNDTAPSVALRVGYFGICAGNGSETKCQSTYGSSPETVLPTLFPDLNNTSSKTNIKSGPSSTSAASTLLSASLAIQSNIFIPLLAGSALSFVVGLPLLFLLKRSLRDPLPENPRKAELLKLATLGSFSLSAVLAFTACLSTSETAGALVASTQLFDDSNLVVKTGISLQVLQWLAFGFVLLFTMAVPWLLRPSGGGGEAEFETYEK